MRYAVLFAAAMLVCPGCAFKDDTPRAKVSNNLQTLEDARLASAKQEPANAQSIGDIKPVALFTGPMPTGVAVSHSGRIFVNFPRWGDPVEFTVAELGDGKAVAYPDLKFNKLDTDHVDRCVVSVQSVVVDAKDRLWILDTGSINFQPPKPAAAKLLCYDLVTNQQIKRIDFPSDVCLQSTYLNDVRFNLDLGEEGTAFITDSSDHGPNGIIVVDLKTGKSMRRLNDHPSTKADEKFVSTVEGEALMARSPGKPEAFLKMGSDGIAISPDGKTLYYCPLASRGIYRVSTDALADRNKSDDEVARTVKELPERNYASDGLECDSEGNLYLTDYEHNAIHRRNADGGGDQIIAQDPRMIWPDSMSIGTDGYLYFTANQLNRQPRFHHGKDLRKQPYVLFQVHLGTQPVASR